MKKRTAPVSPAAISGRILVLHGLRVILDADLATLYGVPTKRFNEQVRRNAGRFPADFMFQITDQELAILRSQIATSSPTPGNHTWGGRRYLPYVFTEHGAIMAANILASQQAIDMSVHVVRAFVRLRETVAGNKELAKRLDELEQKMEHKLSSHDQAIAGILEAIRALVAPPPTVKRRRIGFIQED
jgi:hypothetical protein